MYIYSLGKDEERYRPLVEHLIMKSVHSNNISGKEIYFDNFFKSISFQPNCNMKELVQQVRCVRYANTSRNISYQVKKKFARSGCKYRAAKCIAVVAWMDKKPVYVGSDHIDPKAKTTSTRHEEEGQYKEIECPKLVEKYNNWMCGVDPAYQSIQMYGTD